ncbi:MAG: DUF502 domain-containing protein [Bacteroidetes bacterium]|nr:DUF502 domain-containing protein [Bacteroidota bacterium]MCW5894709.1 DUF502 domain-containing protein [Bacteroidota bacterium]
MNDADNKKGFWAEVRTTFFRGVVVIIPLGLTYWFFSSLLNAIDGIFSPVLEEWLGRSIPGLGFMTMVVLVFLVGLLARNLVGRILFNGFENLLKQIPFVRSVYSAIKDLVGAFTIGGKGKTFREVVMIQYPRPGLNTLAFVTNEMTFHTADNQKVEFYNVYIPNPPNPTSGLLILVPKEQAVKLNLSIEQGLKLVLSGGIVLPEKLEQLKK